MQFHVLELQIIDKYDRTFPDWYVLEKHFYYWKIFNYANERDFFWKEYQFSSDTILNRITLFTVVLYFGIHVRTHYDLDFFLNILLFIDLPTKYFQTCMSFFLILIQFVYSPYWK